MKEVIILLPFYIWVMCVTIGGHLLGGILLIIKGLQTLGKKKAAAEK